MCISLILELHDYVDNFIIKHQVIEVKMRDKSLKMFKIKIFEINVIFVLHKIFLQQHTKLYLECFK